MTFPFFATKKPNQKSGANVPTSQDQLAPHVVNLASNPQVAQKTIFSRKKAILAGVMVLLLTLSAVGVGYFYIRQRTTTPPRANDRYNPPECHDKLEIILNEEGGSSNQNPRGPEAYLKGRVKNNCSKPVTLYMLQFWCEDVSEAKTCGKNKKEPVKTKIMKANDTTKFQIEQAVGNNGRCGSAQVDVRFSPNPPGAGWPENVGGLAYLDPCGPVETLSCDNLAVVNIPDLPKRFKATLTVSDVAAASKFKFDFGDGHVKETIPSEQDFAVNDYATPGAYLIKGSVFNQAGIEITSAACQKSITIPDDQVYRYKSCDSATQSCTPKVCPVVGVDCSTSMSTCTSDANCQVYKYKTCDTDTQTCTPKDCPTIGVDCSSTMSTCANDNTCKAYTYKTCENEACVTKNCNPSNESCSSSADCQSDNDCKSFTHKVCSNQACLSVACPNNEACSDECSSSSECVPQKHYACVNQACQLVNGSGANQCTTNAQCAPVVRVTHRSCLNGACQILNGAGTDSCSSNADCTVAAPATHRACVNQSCQIVSGAGADTCTSDVSCRPVAVAPQVPQTGSTEITIGLIILGIGALAIGALFTL